MLVSGTLAFLCVVLVAYLMITPAWDQNKTLAIGTILGSLLSLCTAILGVIGASYLSNKSDRGEPPGQPPRGPRG